MKVEVPAEVVEFLQGLYPCEVHLTKTRKITEASFAYCSVCNEVITANVWWDLSRTVGLHWHFKDDPKTKSLWSVVDVVHHRRGFKLILV